MDYDSKFDEELEKLLWEFLIRLDQLLPVPNLAQVRLRASTLVSLQITLYLLLFHYSFKLLKRFKLDQSMSHTNVDSLRVLTDKYPTLNGIGRKSYFAIKLFLGEL